MDDIWFTTVVKKWQWERTVERVLNVKMTLAGSGNEGYVSQILFVTLEGILKSGVKTRKHFVVKLAPLLGFASDINEKLGYFRCEVNTYLGLLQSMENLMESHNDHRGRLWPRFYGRWKYERIIFDDLTSKGYEMMDRRKLADLEMSSLVLNCLGRFHAMGLVLLKRNDVQIGEFVSFFFATEETRDAFSLNPLKELAEEIINSWGEKWCQIGKKMSAFNEKIPQLVEEILNLDDSLLNVINHGDFKATNLMIKRDHLGRSVKCKFIDFQLSNYNTFATDLHFFLTVSVVPEIRRLHRRKLLQTYYSSLTETLKFYDYPMDTFPTLSQVEDEMKRTSLIGFMFIPLGAGFTSDIQEKLTITPSEDGLTCACDSKNYTTAKFKEYFSQDIKHFIDEGYI